MHADRMRGLYRDHGDGARPFGPYAAEWFDNGGNRGHLALGTAAVYRELVARDLEHFAVLPLSTITAPVVRKWYTAARRSVAERAASRGDTEWPRERQR